MVNLETVWTVSTVLVVQAVSLGQEVLERARGRDERRARCFIQSPEIRGALASPHALIVHDLATTVYLHARKVVREIEQGSGPPDGEPSTGIQTEEVDAGPFSDSNVCPNVEFRKC
jgi:hypothetical protein